jgi:hypothetical protein
VLVGVQAGEALADRAQLLLGRGCADARPQPADGGEGFAPACNGGGSPAA